MNLETGSAATSGTSTYKNEDEEMEDAVTSNPGTILVIFSSICRLNRAISNRVMKLWRLIFLQPSTSLTSPRTTRTSHRGPWGEETGKRPLARSPSRRLWRNRQFRTPAMPIGLLFSVSRTGSRRSTITFCCTLRPRGPGGCCKRGYTPGGHYDGENEDGAGSQPSCL